MTDASLSTRDLDLTDTDSTSLSVDTAETADLRERVEHGIVLLLPRVLNQESGEPAALDASLMADLGLTSGKTLELVLELEDHLDIQIDVEDITPDDLNTITTLAAFVAAHVVAED
ncbi:MAG: acyl carrier protein [Streptomyces sp.]|jgi:acyl carrier protein|nr:acyl carrier protein [Streptomyces sp.]